MNNPYFSILLPTKNRANYLKESILSVLLQDFDSYELIISDNFNTFETKNVIEEFINHPNLKYYRTESELSMPDNWEFALSHASGKYIMVLPDRKLLYKGALKTIYNSIQKFKEPDCCSWVVKVYDEDKKHMGWFPHEIKIGKDRLIKSSLLVDNFLSEKYLSSKSLDFYFPKSLNGCFKKSLAVKAIGITGHFFNNEFATTPDYSSLFIQLAFSDSVLHIGTPIYLSQGESTSNGRYSGSVDCRPYLKSLRFNDYFKYVDVKVPFIYNLLLNDFLCIKDKIGHNLSGHTIDYINYYSSLYIDLESLESIGLMTEENYSYYKNGLNSVFQTASLEVKSKVKERISKFKMNDNSNISSLNKATLHIRDYIRHNYAQYSLVNSLLNYRFENALLAAGFKNHHSK
jgi:glycosyltransferase involved in cell wall biosynthesis